MTKSRLNSAMLVAGLICVASTAGAATLAPLASFGGGDGWRAPFEVLPGDAVGTDSIQAGFYNYLGNTVTNTAVNGGNLERGLAFNPATGHLILVSRNNGSTPGIRILDGMTGVDLGQLNQGGAVTGGFFATDMVGVADDGAIYVGNLSLDTNTSPFKVYRWGSESDSAPTVAFSGTPNGLLAGARIGDTFDVIGSGVNTRLVAGYGSTPAVAGNNSFALFTTTDGLNFSATHVGIAGTPPDGGDFRLGITFQDSDTVIGKTLANGRIVDVSGAVGTLVNSFDTDGSTLRAMDFAVVAGKPLLAIMECSTDQGPLGRARLFVYDMNDPTAPLVERKIIEGSNLPLENPGGPNQFVNGNGTGQVKFGPINGNVTTIYAMSTNNGIQAFELTLESSIVNLGDYNLNGLVDAADYVLWRDTLGQQVTPGSGADGDGNGTIGAGDYEYWRAQFGSLGIPPASASVPEPNALVLWVMTAVRGMVMTRRRR